MVQAIQSVFREIKDFIYPNNCGASKITSVSCYTPQFGYKIGE